MTQIDFLVIGAEKAGTTSLFEYVRHHPQIHMPAEKELSFFGLDANFSRGWEWYQAAALAGASPGMICGEASVGYMMGTPFRLRSKDEQIEPYMLKQMAPENVIPERIKSFLPEVKLVCVLRDPVERAFSHYRMARLNGAEDRSFDETLDDLLQPANLTEARSVRTLTNGYVVNSEYTRILKSYYQLFDSQQIRVVFSDALSTSTVDTLGHLFAFLGVSPDFIPPNLQTKYREAAVRQKSSLLDLYAWQSRLGRLRPARAMWHKLPDRARFTIARRIGIASYRMALWNRRTDIAQEEISSDARARLIDHFQADTDGLASLIGEEAPWRARWTTP